MSLSLDEVVQVTGGTLWTAGLDLFTGFIIDSREARGGELFFPLQGEKTDGHNFIVDALKNGAAGSLLESGKVDFIAGEVLPPGKTLIIVEDTLQALHKLALAHRKKYFLPVIAVTGSNGKTTTKDFIASVLATRYNVLKTEGNLNNHLGLPLMLLRLEKEHEAAVLEMGMSGFGEIARLAALALPSLGVITNIGEAHLEHLGSRENIARAKNELLEFLGPAGKAFLNGDDLYLQRMGEAFSGEVFYFGFGERAGLRALDYFSSPEGSTFRLQMPEGQREEFKIPLPGKHNVYNALAAVAVGMHFNIEREKIKDGLAGAKISRMRMEKFVAKGGFSLINDTYNASPSSMKAALQTLKEQAGNKMAIAVLGGMLELGTMTEEGHLEIGKHVADLSLDYLVTVGELASFIARGAREAGLSGKKIFEAADRQEAIEHLKAMDLQGSCILLKGSRMMRLEQIADELLNDG